MEEFIGAWLGDTDRAVCGAIAILATMFGTQLIKLACNAKHWILRRNPVAAANTDRFMPLVPFVVGTLYGLFLGPDPGMADNVRNGLVYGALSVALFCLLKKTILGR